MSSELIGRRVASFDDLERAGDYCGPQSIVLAGDKPGRVVWFLLPIHEGATVYDRPSVGSGLHGVYEPPWSFRECDDGSVEIRASILCGRTDESPNGYWHGYLNEGHRWSW